MLGREGKQCYSWSGFGDVTEGQDGLIVLIVVDSL